MDIFDLSFEQLFGLFFVGYFVMNGIFFLLLGVYRLAKYALCKLFSARNDVNDDDESC